ncbi:MAG: hypothetical protein AAF672_12240 [Pseudomonadota bacterium]
MTNPLQNLLALDRLAQKTGAGLRPELRRAIEADLSFSPKRAGPPQKSFGAAEALPDGVHRLLQRPAKDKAG